VDIDLSTGAPASPERTRQLAEAFAELARVLNHATMDRAAFGVPSDIDRVLWEVEAAVSRLPQLLSQLTRWVAAEDAAGRVAVAGGEEQSGHPAAAVLALADLGEVARMSAGTLRADLRAMARVTGTLAAAGPI